MSQSLIDRLLSGTLPDPDGGPPLQVATRSVAIAPTLEGSEAELVRALAFGKHLAVVNQESDTVLASRVDAGNGRLKPSGIFASVTSPVCVTFLAPPEPPP